jgi:micrococcal nuclease
MKTSFNRQQATGRRFNRAVSGSQFPVPGFLGRWFLAILRWMGCAIALCLIGLLAGCQTAIEPSGIWVSVRQVASGQALEIVNASGQTPTPQKVRLLGIDAPDLKQQPWGIDAKQRLEELVRSKSVRLEFDVERQDQYGRSLAYVWVGNQLANEQLVAAGYALAMPRSPNVKYQEKLQRAQESARLMGRGIWNPENPLRQTPTEFRRQNR